ncbi:MAG TPA: hypothetical protein VK731_01570, partial [Candidatus Cybelea sp.]|nr:hypothetical protein [Candidatus Cybelea sp.]
MQPVHTRKKKNSTKVNLIYSVVFHALIIGVVGYISARSGLLGERVQEIFMASLEKKPEEKPPPPKIVEPPKIQEKPQVQPLAAPPVQMAAAAPPPPAAGPAAVAPAPADISDALYDPNATKVESSTNAAVDYYKNWVE